MADIILRHIQHPETIKKHTGDPQSTTEIIATASDQGGVTSAATPDPPKPDGISDEQWTEHLKTLAAIHEWTEVHGDEPFLDPIEYIDPEVRTWRQILRDRYNFNKRYDQRRDTTGGG